MRPSLFLLLIIMNTLFNCNDSSQEGKQAQLARIQHSSALLLRRTIKEGSLRACPKGSVGLKHHHPHQGRQQVLLAFQAPPQVD